MVLIWRIADNLPISTKLSHYMVSVNFIVHPKSNSLLVIVILVTALPEHIPSGQPHCCVSVI